MAEAATFEVEAVQSPQSGGVAGTDVLYNAILFQGLLTEFSKSEVQDAFLKGLLGVPDHSAEMLKCIILIHQLLLPIMGVQHDTGTDRCVVATCGAQFLSGLLNQGADEPLDVDTNTLPIRKTYKGWHHYFSLLACSQYWHLPRAGLSVRSRVEPSRSIGTQVGESVASREGGFSGVPSDMGNLCIRDDSLPPKVERHPSPKAVQIQHSSFGKPHNIGGGLSSVFSPDQTERRVYRGRCRDRRDPRSPSLEHSLDEVALGLHGREAKPRSRRYRSYRRDGSDTDSVASTQSSRAGDIDFGREGPGRGSLSQALRNLEAPRDVVPPEVFDGSDGASLREFLSEYEGYFSLKYKGTDRQQAKVLADFLSGSVKRAYEAMGGLKMRYSDLKPKMLEWYRSEKVSSRHKAERDLEQASMLPGDTLSIYALRLEHLADRAFPNAIREQEHQLCKVFWRTVPSSFKRVLADAERNLALSSGRRKLSWTIMKRLSEAEDRQLKFHNCESDVEPKKPAVWFSRPNICEKPQTSIETNNSPRRPGNGNTGHNYGSTTRRDFKSSGANQGHSPAKGGRVLPSCDWCGRRGHREIGCWERVGRCVLCGSNQHQRDGCPQFDSQKTYGPICSRCRGEHLGKYCPERNPGN